MAFVASAPPIHDANPGLDHASTTATAQEPVELHSVALTTSEILFRPGDLKTHFYRVESGVVCVYQSPWQGHRATVEFCFPGDLVGLGFLERHTSTARAAVDTVVSCLPLDAMNDVIACDPLASARLARAVDKEFDSVRSHHLSLPLAPIERVAALLITLSRANSQEGRDPSSITDSLKCGVIADYLAMSVDELAGILVELEKCGFIERWPSGVLRLTDMDGLDRLAEGADHDEINDELANEITEDELTEEVLRAPPAFLRRGMPGI
jgi:CRP/FNR family transcriptional regulator, anaerobic regulatory protein